MACNEKWLDPNSPFKDLFSKKAFSELTDKAKTLTLSDLMRLSYYARPGDLPPNQDRVLQTISMEDMMSIAKAMEIHIKEKGIDDGWKYVGSVFACMACVGCAVTLPPEATIDNAL
jgi:hypothetical protein